MYPDVTHTWYTDDVGAFGMYGKIELYFNLYQVMGITLNPQKLF